MHSLHRILIYIPECTSKEAKWEEQKDNIRRHAKVQTAEYYEQVFDWRETETAGRWEEEYPQQVYRASDDLDWFIKELNDAMATQDYEIEYCLKQLKSDIGTDVEKIYQSVKQSKNTDSFSLHYLMKLSKLLNGEYINDSCFFDTHNFTAQLSEETTEEIKQKPEDWALVMFDYHY